MTTRTKKVKAEQAETITAEQTEAVQKVATEQAEVEAKQEPKEPKEQEAMSRAKQAQDLYKEYGTKSATIRHLAELGWSRSEIAKAMDIRYQHVRNVLIQPLKRGPQVETEKN